MYLFGFLMDELSVLSVCSKTLLIHLWFLPRYVWGRRDNPQRDATWPSRDRVGQYLRLFAKRSILIVQLSG